jgi:hypothetical protein
MPRGSRGTLSVNGIISKIGRMAVSKAAAFGYAVAVGVAGNLAFNFVQQHHSAPVSVAPHVAATVGDGATLATMAPKPAPAKAAPAPLRASLPVAPRGPEAAARAVVAALPLPEPPAFALPSPD